MSLRSSDKPRHIQNLKQVYTYHMDPVEIYKDIVKMRQDLSYDLNIDSRYKRAIIYNKSGLEKELTEMVSRVIGENLETLGDLVVDDITAQLNSLTTDAHGQFVKSKSYSSHLGSIIGKALGKSLVKGFNKFLDDITDTNRRR